MGGHRFVVSVVRQLAWDADLGCERLRGVGYRATCRCGWRGVVLPTVARARADYAAHLAEIEAGAEQDG